jgi:hypothetical protein
MPACRALSPPDLHAQFVGAPETRAAVASRLASRGVRHQDIEDLTQVVTCGATSSPNDAARRAIAWLQRR